LAILMSVRTYVSHRCIDGYCTEKCAGEERRTLKNEGRQIVARDLVCQR
jgi:hypothetical protein